MAKLISRQERWEQFPGKTSTGNNTQTKYSKKYVEKKKEKRRLNFNLLCSILTDHGYIWLDLNEKVATLFNTCDQYSFIKKINAWMLFATSSANRWN